MNPIFRPEPEASAELEDAAIWYNGQRPGLGVEWPHIGRAVPGVPHDVPARRFPIQRFPYHIVYFEWAGAIRILACAHDCRRPGYWFSRV